MRYGGSQGDVISGQAMIPPSTRTQADAAEPEIRGVVFWSVNLAHTTQKKQAQINNEASEQCEVNSCGGARMFDRNGNLCPEFRWKQNLCRHVLGFVERKRRLTQSIRPKDAQPQAISSQLPYI
ncbi:hypothetical protein PROFUN_11724 [Planoprotostelium fungivorum]|uniref:SWIM-type domain-containing protein n=1 Tax=Planoprotostelium fungivorum TaxID=1890364 RepID=A0A2P6N980_9EUKA|nr:hypothetical protein PROFUN_11724 [Planoprotostelium fungivorum]